MNDDYQLVDLAAPAALGEAIRQTANVTETNLNELTGAGDTSLHDHAGISENTTHRGSDGSDHDFLDQDVSAAAAPTFAGITLSSDGKLELITPAGTGDATGLIQPATVDTNAAAYGGIIYLNVADSNWDTADKDDTATGGAVMVAMALGTTGSIDILFYGEVHNTDWDWTPGKPLYLADDGDMTETPPNAVNDVVRLMGHATHADKMFFNPSPDWIIHAA
jgi:hypothetical protein